MTEHTKKTERERRLKEDRKEREMRGIMEDMQKSQYVPGCMLISVLPYELAFQDSGSEMHNFYLPHRSGVRE